jgi:hypothetical protein
MENTNIMVEFNIIGSSFEPKTVTKKLDITPSETYKIGDEIAGKKRRHAGH